MTSLPARSQVVVIGGGVVGCSIAYHLAERGVTDVTLLERRQLTGGSTWHAAGLVGQLRTSSSLTMLMQQSVRTYETLEERTGYATGWRGVGSVRIASSPDRWEELQRLATTGRSFGFDVHLVSPREAGDLFPLLDTDGVHGATWIPSDGYVDPSQLTHSFAAGARAAGVRIVQNCRVESIERAGRRITAVVTGQGRVECDTLVNATGMWGTETARRAGVDLAVNAVEHQYVVTERSDGIPRDLPTLRDPDARFYLKPENGGLVVGGWEEGTRAPWRRIPVDLGPELFRPDHDRFAGIAEGAATRIPPLLNVRGGIEADVTITRLGEHEFYFVTGSGFGRHDLTFLLQHAPDDGSVHVRDVTSAYGVLNLCGPRSRAIATTLSWADMSNDAFPFMTAQHIDLGFAAVRALRAGYVGELGWEFHVPTEYMAGLYDQLLEAGREFGIRDVGYRAVESLRLEKQYLAWATDIRADTIPYEAGLGFAVRPDKPELLAGPALRRVRDDGVRRRLCWFSADPEAIMHGGELLTHDSHDLAATVRSAGFGHTVGRTIFSAYVPVELASEDDFVVDVATRRFPARREKAPMYDPAGLRLRS